MTPHLHDLAHRLAPVTFFVVAQFGFDFGGIGDALGGLLGTIETIVAEVFAFLWNVLVAVFNYLLSGLIFLLNFFYGLMVDVGNAFKWLWQNIVKVALTKLVNVFFRVRAFLQRIFGPVIRWLKIARQIMDQYFNKFVKPVLNLIRHVRQVLQVFRLLGFKWAGRLDARLAQIENKIVQAYELIRQHLNEVISWVQLIVDPTFLLRRVPLFGALIRSAPELQNVLDNATQHTPSPDELDKMNRARKQSSLAAYKADYETYFSAGTLPPDTAASQAMFEKQIEALIHG